MSSSAHLFFSYAHDDAERLTPIHAQMQNVLERNLWLDKVGLERGVAWENAIKAAIDDSYGVIFAVTETFITRSFILEKEIPWALDKFKDKQGAQLFPILFDDVELPNDLKTPFITHLIDARDGNMERVFEELKRVLPAAQAGTQPFVLDWPRLANFKGRDSQLIELHQKLIGDGRVGVKTKTAGLHGTGGIGKTQLAVEYAHRYRYHYPGGVYWLNAGADWRKEVAACAVNLDRSLIEKSDEEKALAFRDYLAAQGKDALLVLDNVDDPAEVTRREVAPKLTISELCGQTRARLLLTTRVQTLPTGFESVPVDVLKPEDARAVLLDAWVNGGRKDTADRNSLDVIAKTLGYLPLGLILATAALSKRPTLTPAKFLEHLRDKGIDDIANRVGLEKAGPAGYVSRVDVALEWQIGQLERDDSRNLLALLAPFGEAAVTPRERLRLLAGMVDDDLDTPFADAAAELVDYHLVEALSEGMAFRLHPLTQQYVTRVLKPSEKLMEAVPHLVAAYRDPATLDEQTRMRGFGEVMGDLRAVASTLTPGPSPSGRGENENKANYEKLEGLTRLLTLEEPHLLAMQAGLQAGYVVQQVRERARHEGDDDLKAACDRWLEGKRYLHHEGLRHLTNKALLRTLSMHSDSVTGALVLTDGRILSWSSDNTLRLWTAEGAALATLEGHSGSVTGAQVLANGRILSWSYDGTLRLWDTQGATLATLEGHTSFITGAQVLADGRILSWSYDYTLRLWTGEGTALATLEGHTSLISGAQMLGDGRILSWSSDRTLRLWTGEGTALATLKGHNGWVTGAQVLADGRILSWSADGTLRLWTAEGAALATLEGHNGSVSGALELADGRILSWSSDRTLRLWTGEGTALATLKGHNGWVTGAQVLADRRILSWSADGTLRLWTAEGAALATLEGHSGSVSGALELADGRILSWLADGTLRLWTGEGAAFATLEGHSNTVNGAQVLGDGRILSWSADGTLRLWMAEESTALPMLEGHSGRVIGAQVLGDGRILSWSADGTLRLWTAEGAALTVLEGHSGRVIGVQTLADGRMLSWSADGRLRLWTAEGAALTVLEGHSGRVIGAQALADGRILSWAYDLTPRLWTGEGAALATLEGHTSHIIGAQALGDGRILSWAYDGTLRLWDKDGAALSVLEGHSDRVSGAQVLGDGLILSWSADKTLRLWGKDGATLGTLEGHSGYVNGAQVLVDGCILSWSWDTTLRLWTAEGTALRSLEGHSDEVTGALELSDECILSWSYDGTLRLWGKDGAALSVLEGHSDWVNGALVLADGRMLSWAEDWKVRLWSKDGEPLAAYASDSAITCCTVTKDGRIVVGDQGGRVLFLTLEEGT